MMPAHRSPGNAFFLFFSWLLVIEGVTLALVSAARLYCSGGGSQIVAFSVGAFVGAVWCLIMHRAFDHPVSLRTGTTLVYSAVPICALLIAVRVWHVCVWGDAQSVMTLGEAGGEGMMFAVFALGSISLARSTVVSRGRTMGQAANDAERESNQ